MPQNIKKNGHYSLFTVNDVYPSVINGLFPVFFHVPTNE